MVCVLDSEKSGFEFTGDSVLFSIKPKILKNYSRILIKIAYLNSSVSPLVCYISYRE